MKGNNPNTLGRERERERERDRQTDRDRDRERQRKRERESEREQNRKRWKKEILPTTSESTHILTNTRTLLPELS